MEEHWIAKRSQLRQLLQDQPDWTNQMYADALDMSRSWVKDWKPVFRKADPDDESVVLGRPRHRRTPLEDYDPDVIEAVLDIRDHPPEYCPRTPGPAVIQYELAQRFADTDKRFPRSTSTIWTILDQHQRIIRPSKREREPIERPDPMTHWEIDFTDITSIPGDPDGKRQHAVEMFNVVDRGTSILVESTASDDYNTESSIIAMTSVFLVEGLPETLTIDRDPRFVGGYQGDDFPSAFMRFLLCLDIDVDVCPPRRPDLKPFVEYARYGAAFVRIVCLFFKQRCHGDDLVDRSAERCYIFFERANARVEGFLKCFDDLSCLNIWGKTICVRKQVAFFILYKQIEQLWIKTFILVLK